MVVVQVRVAGGAITSAGGAIFCTTTTDVDDAQPFVASVAITV